jgi:hypothetical protein
MYIYIYGIDHSCIFYMYTHIYTYIHIYIGEDHWILRSAASQIVASACRKYSVLFPDLQARVCKTYVDALILSLNTVSKGKDIYIYIYMYV